MARFDIGTFGAPEEPHRHHRTREAASLVAALAGALAIMLAGLMAIAGVGPGKGTWAWVALPILIVIWLSGLWWRWDSPDRRKATDERQRRGF